MTPPPVLLDFESVSRAPIKDCGGRRYWQHGSTRAICCAWRDLRDDSCGVWVPGETWPHPNRELAAHNMQSFDRFGCEKYGFRALDYIDTSHCARRAGLPGALDALGSRWLGVPKDEEGSRFTRSLSSVARPTKRTAHRAPLGEVITQEEWRALERHQQLERGVQPEITSEVLARVIEYCESDVEIMYGAWERLAPWLDVDFEVAKLDRTVNDRGYHFDQELAVRLYEAHESHVHDACVRAARELGKPISWVYETAGAPAKFSEFLGTADATKQTYQHLDHPLAHARTAIASILPGKVIAALNRVTEGSRIRDSLTYHAAATGRWGGGGFQPHNLTRPPAELEDTDPDELADRVLRSYLPSLGECDLLLRALICAPPGRRLAAADLSGVEAITLAWLAGDEDEIAVHTGPQHPYNVEATHIFGVAYDAVEPRQRSAGKVAVLASGYQGGVGAWTNMATKLGIDLSDIDVGAAVKAWRSAHPKIVALWYRIERAFKSVITRGRPVRVSCGTNDGVEIVPHDNGEDVAIFLPSGRPIVYCNAALDNTDRQSIVYEGTNDHTNERVIPYCPDCFVPVGTTKYCECGETLKGQACPTHGKVSPLRWCNVCRSLIDPIYRVQTYGGKLVENIVQGTDRDVLAEAMIRIEAAGVPIVLHVHDECVGEVAADAAQDALDTIVHELSRRPTWAPDLPLSAKGWTGRRFRK